MKRIGIIGGGFTGTMTAVQLIERANGPLAITIVNDRGTFNKGVAYDPYSKGHLLNVTAAKMSAYPDRPNHFMDWVMARPSFAHTERILVANAFLPRDLYGEYLTSVWNNAEAIAVRKKIKVRVIEDTVADLDVTDDAVDLILRSGQRITLDRCVIATGNHAPRDPGIRQPAFYQNPRYFRNPWNVASVSGADSALPILIIGNGLTMVDTVLGLLEHGFTNTIWSISPNGYNILPHRHNGLAYTKLTEELRDTMTLRELVALVNKHIRSVREFGVSAEPVIDSIRPHVQRIWKRLTPAERRIFMARLRHLWGVARHRVPLHIHDRLQQLRIDGRLRILSGRLIDISEENGAVHVEHFDHKRQATATLQVCRVINCTGPETDLMRLEEGFLKNALLKGSIAQDELKLGIRTDTETFAVLDATGRPHERLFTLGSNLKGELWESTAVNELRAQAELLAKDLLLLPSGRKVATAPAR
ncbi:MAG: FAD/NAD(P)-binding protein [Flavobacteriales bacterium]